MRIINPYDGVNWSNQQKANLHTHTSLQTINDVLYGSDGSYTQAQAIDHYYNNGYKVLALTDHDYVDDSQVTTFPWTVFGRDPKTLGMIAVEGKELSRCNHICSLFNNLGFVDTEDESVALEAVKANDGIAVINHPGRYSESENWYANLYLSYPDVAVALEVYNQGDRYPDDRKLWDKINAITIPQGKIVFGCANDDMHREEDRFITYQYILSELNEVAVRTAIENGQTYFSSEPLGNGVAKAPRITSIVVDENAKTISISADSGTITWISAATETVGTGAVFNYSGFKKSFVRAEIANEFGTTCTQPFAFAYSDEYRTQLEVESICTYANGKIVYLEKTANISGKQIEITKVKI